jgi:hypothetical protein
MEKFKLLKTPEKFWKFWKKFCKSIDIPWRTSDVAHRLDFIGFCESFGYIVYNTLKDSEEYNVMGYLASLH